MDLVSGLRTKQIVRENALWERLSEDNPEKTWTNQRCGRMARGRTNDGGPCTPTWSPSTVRMTNTCSAYCPCLP